MMYILEYFPNRIRQAIHNCLNSDEESCLEEIRIRVQRPIILKIGNQKKEVNYQITTQDVLTIMEKITENSLYSYQKQICEGFITLRGGHRVGISGNIVMENDKVININYVYSLNFRIARQVLGVSDKILKEVIDHEKINNILIISPPGAGKTTLLRDLIRNISTSKTVGVVDERGEIAAMYKNEPQNDIGLNVDILSNVSKAIGMKMLVRSMSPEIICADEIGTKEDVEAIREVEGVEGEGTGFEAHGVTPCRRPGARAGAPARW